MSASPLRAQEILTLAGNAEDNEDGPAIALSGISSIISTPLDCGDKSDDSKVLAGANAPYLLRCLSLRAEIRLDPQLSHVEVCFASRTSCQTPVSV